MDCELTKDKRMQSSFCKLVNTDIEPTTDQHWLKHNWCRIKSLGSTAFMSWMDKRVNGAQGPGLALITCSQGLYPLEYVRWACAIGALTCVL
jgi:hypothetical protein